VVKAPPKSANLGDVQVNTRGKAGIGSGMESFLNPYVVTKSEAEAAFNTTRFGNLTVKVGGTLSFKHTFHGRTAALVAVPVGGYAAVYFAGPYLASMVAGLGASQFEPSQLQPGGILP